MSMPFKCAIFPVSVCLAQKVKHLVGLSGSPDENLHFKDDTLSSAGANLSQNN